MSLPLQLSQSVVPPELITETPAPLPTTNFSLPPPSQTLQSLPVSSDLPLIQTSEPTEYDLLDVPALSEVGDLVDADVDDQCNELLTELGVEPDKIRKLCGAGYFTPIEDLKLKFENATQWYQNQLQELESDKAELNSMVLAPDTNPDLRARAKNALNTLQERYSETEQAYLAMLQMNSTVSKAVDALADIRKEVLQMVSLLRDKLREGGLYGADLSEQQRSIIEQSQLDNEIQNQLGSSLKSSSTPLSQEIAESVNDIIQTEGTAKKNQETGLTPIEDEEEESEEIIL